MSSAFPSPVIGHGAHHNHHQGHHHHSHNNQSQSNGCCTNGGYSGSQTLPANCNGNLQEWSSKSLAHCHPSTSDDGELQWWSISARTMGMFALSLVFILIWTSVISGILVTHSYKEHEIANNAAELFALQKQLGQFAFIVGKEMVQMLNISFAVAMRESVNENQTIDTSTLINESSNFLEHLRPSFAAKELHELHEDLVDALGKFRARCHFDQNRMEQFSRENISSEHPIFSYSTACIRAFEHEFGTLESFALKDNPWLSERHSKLVQNDLVLRNLPYTLFIKGVLHRFSCLAMGMVLINSDFNSSLVPMSEYYHYYYSSRQLIDSSFLWNQRFLAKYIDLEKSDFTSLELLFKIFEQKSAEEKQFFGRMSRLFHQVIGVSGLRRIKSEIKKKNVESVERILEIDEGSGKRSKYVADPNQIHFQIKPELFENFGLENIEQMIVNHDQMASVAERRTNLSVKYNQVILYQFDFLARVQDFLNISISAQLVQSRLSEESNFLYHSMVSAILICSVLFCLLLFCCSYCCSRNLPLSTPSHNQKMPFGRRMRRQFWALSGSPLSILGGCFSSSSGRTQRPSQSSGTGSNRYPLLYKSSNHHRSQSPNCNGQASNSNCTQCLPCSPSPSAFLLTSKRTFHRYLASQQNSHSHQHSHHNSHRHVFKSRHSVAPTSNGRHAETSMVAKISTNTSEPQQSVNTNGGCRSSSHGCCMACRDPSCTGFYDPGESAKYSAPVQSVDKCVCHNCSELVVDNDGAPSATPSSTRLEKRNITTPATQSRTHKDRETPGSNHKSLTRYESSLSVGEATATVNKNVDSKARPDWEERDS